MGSSSDVFKLRREGKIEEALNLAKELYNENSNDEWNAKALGWSLIDKIKISTDLSYRCKLIEELNQI